MSLTFSVCSTGISFGPSKSTAVLTRKLRLQSIRLPSRSTKDYRRHFCTYLFRLIIRFVPSRRVSKTVFLLRGLWEFDRSVKVHVIF